MTPITVRADRGTSDTAAAVLASLPVSYAPAQMADSPAVSIVDGGVGWPRQVREALDVGARGVIVVHPEPLDVESLTGVSTPVVLDSIWAGNPAVAAAADSFHGASTSAQLVECRIVTAPGRSPAACLLDAATLLRAVISPLSRLELLARDSTSFIAIGEIGRLGVGVSLLTSTGVAPHAYLRTLTDDGGVEITIPHPGTARPAEVVITDQTGTRTLPTLWESSHRATWRRTHELVRAGDPCTDLVDLAADLRVLDDALTQLATVSVATSA